MGLPELFKVVTLTVENVSNAGELPELGKVDNFECDTFKNCEGLSCVAFMDGNGCVM